MILLDTHIWVWWIHGDDHLNKIHTQHINENEKSGIGISIISCWEVAKLVQNKRISLPCDLDTWFKHALHYPGVNLINLAPEIITKSVQLPGYFHSDPADQLIVATALILECTLLTVDTKIKKYPHVNVL